MMNTANKMTVKQFHILQYLTSVFLLIFSSEFVFVFVCLFRIVLAGTAKLNL